MKKKDNKIVNIVIFKETPYYKCTHLDGINSDGYSHHMICNMYTDAHN